MIKIVAITSLAILTGCSHAYKFQWQSGPNITLEVTPKGAVQ